MEFWITSFQLITYIFQLSVIWIHFAFNKFCQLLWLWFRFTCWSLTLFCFTINWLWHLWLIYLWLLFFIFFFLCLSSSSFSRCFLHFLRSSFSFSFWLTCFTFFVLLFIFHFFFLFRWCFLYSLWSSFYYWLTCFTFFIFFIIFFFSLTFFFLFCCFSCFGRLSWFSYFSFSNFLFWLFFFLFLIIFLISFNTFRFSTTSSRLCWYFLFHTFLNRNFFRRFWFFIFTFWTHLFFLLFGIGGNLLNTFCYFLECFLWKCKKGNSSFASWIWFCGFYFNIFHNFTKIYIFFYYIFSLTGKRISSASLYVTLPSLDLSYYSNFNTLN